MYVSFTCWNRQRGAEDVVVAARPPVAPLRPPPPPPPAVVTGRPPRKQHAVSNTRLPSAQVAVVASASDFCRSSFQFAVVTVRACCINGGSSLGPQGMPTPRAIYSIYD